MEREKKIIKTSIIGIVTNIILVIFKMTIGLIVNSIAVVLDAVNNLTDVLSSLITIIGTKLANRAPDKEHPYGHGRIEYFTAIIISVIILFAGVAAGKESIVKIVDKSEAEYSIISMVIIAVAVIVKVVLGNHFKKVGKELDSGNLVASGEDATMDAVLSFSTLVAAIVNYIFHIGLEGYLGVIISIVIIRAAINLLKETINSILGKRADKELTDKIKKKVCSYKEVQGAFDLSLHNYGPSKIIGSVHIQVRDDMTAAEIHILSRQIVYDIYNKFGIILTVGIYAANEKGEFGEIKKKLKSILKEYKEILQLHGFYVDDKTKNVFFDIIIDFEAKNHEEIREEIIRKLKAEFPKYSFNIILDPDISE